MTEWEVKQLRIAVVGSGCSGKTCVIKRFVDNSFHGSQYVATSGVEFYSRRMNFKSATVTLIIVEISGSAIESKLLPIYLSGVQVFMLNYDMTNMTSLQELRKWITIISTLYEQGRREEPTLALVGSKGDLEHLRAVRLDSHTNFVHEFNLPLSFLVSAKSGDSVQTCFTKSVAYHLSPEAKQNTRDHAIIKSTMPKKQSVSMGIPSGSSESSDRRRLQAAVGSDPNSTVCALQ